MAAGAKILSAVLKFSIVIDHMEKLLKSQRFFFLAASASEKFQKFTKRENGVDVYVDFDLMCESD